MQSIINPLLRMRMLPSHFLGFRLPKDAVGVLKVWEMGWRGERGEIWVRIRDFFEWV